MQPGDVIEVITPGAGGYGAAGGASPSSWREIVRRAAITSEAARTIYGSAP